MAIKQKKKKYLIQGILDNTKPGTVTGWMKFFGLKRKMMFNLKGDFHRDIRGAKIHFVGDAYLGHVNPKPFVKQ